MSLEHKDSRDILPAVMHSVSEHVAAAHRDSALKQDALDELVFILVKDANYITPGEVDRTYSLLNIILSKPQDNLDHKRLDLKKKLSSQTRIDLLSEVYATLSKPANEIRPEDLKMIDDWVNKLLGKYKQDVDRNSNETKIHMIGESSNLGNKANRTFVEEARFNFLNRQISATPTVQHHGWAGSVTSSSNVPKGRQ